MEGGSGVRERGQGKGKRKERKGKGKGERKRKCGRLLKNATKGYLCTHTNKILKQ